MASYREDPPDEGKPSKPVTLAMARDFVRLHKRGWFQNRIAAKWDVNPGRVCEVVNKQKFPEAHEPEPPRLL